MWDLNDNLLIFEFFLYEEIILESIFFGIVVLCVCVMDVDWLYVNSKMVFLIFKEVLDYDFVVNLFLGVIYVNKFLDFERM